jgi:hypothetical protein
MLRALCHDCQHWVPHDEEPYLRVCEKGKPITGGWLECEYFLDDKEDREE